MAKKNPFKSAIILSTVALALFLMNYFVLVPQKEKKDKAKTQEALLFPDIERSDVLEVKLTNSKGSFQLRKKADGDNKWIVSEKDKTFDGDKTAIEGLITTLLSAKKESSTAEKNLSAIGLEPAGLRVSITHAKDKTQDHELLLGADSKADYFLYAKWSDKEESFLTSRSLRFGVDKSLNDLRNKKIMSLDFNKMTQISLKSLGDEKSPSQNLTFIRPDTKSPWTVANARKKITLDVSEIEKWINGINSLVVTSFASENSAQRNQFGFRNPVASLTITYEAEDKKPARTEAWVMAKAQDPSSPEKIKPFKNYFAELSGPSTYEIAETFKDNFKVDLFKFRPKKIINFEKSQVSALTLSDGKNVFEFKKNQDQWAPINPPGQTLGALKTNSFSKLFDALFQSKAQSFADNLNPQSAGFSNPQRIIEFRGQKDGQEVPLGTLFVGTKVKDKTYYIRSENLDAPAVVELDIENLAPLNWDHFTESVQKVEEKKDIATESALLNTTQATIKPSEGKKKMKLEPTVKSTREIKKLPAAIVKPGHRYTAKIELSSGLVLGMEFAADKAPYTVSNFLHLARNGYYDGVKFHRVIPKFVVQGGDPTGSGAGGPGYEFDNEDNDLKHVRGALSMAHKGRNTNGSQFFIVLAPQPHLDGVHPIFGKVTDGLDKIDTIKQGDSMKKVEVFEEAL
jgi:peptidyl-prolyl cis-trans isomerase B (cyclophilin B)